MGDNPETREPWVVLYWGHTTLPADPPRAFTCHAKDMTKRRLGARRQSQAASSAGPSTPPASRRLTPTTGTSIPPRWLCLRPHDRDTHTPVFGRGFFRTAAAGAKRKPPENPRGLDDNQSVAVLAATWALSAAMNSSLVAGEVIRMMASNFAAC